MSYQTTEEKILFPHARKRYGFSNLFGLIHFGYALFGDENSYSGIYQLRNSAGQREYVKMRFYWPTNPRTVPQQARRAVMADGVAGWHALSPEDVLYWQNKAKKMKLSGYNAFLSDYLFNH